MPLLSNASSIGGLITTSATGAPSPWLPSAVTPQLWIDESCYTISSGSELSAIANKATGGTTGTKVAGVSFPNIGVETLNGLAVLSNDGTRDLRFTLPGGSQNAANAIIAAAFRANTNDPRLWNFRLSSNSQAIVDPGNNFGFGVRTRTTAGVLAEQSSAADFVWHIGVWSFTRTGVSGFYLDGATAPAASLTQTASINATQLGLMSNGFQADAAIGRGNGSVAEIIARRNYTATQNEIDRLVGFLAHKWGLTGNLPLMHPYKLFAPTT